MEFQNFRKFDKNCQKTIDVLRIFGAPEKQLIFLSEYQIQMVDKFRQNWGLSNKSFTRFCQQNMEQYLRCVEFSEV